MPKATATMRSCRLMWCLMCFKTPCSVKAWSTCTVGPLRVDVGSNSTKSHRGVVQVEDVDEVPTLGQLPGATWVRLSAKALARVMTTCPSWRRWSPAFHALTFSWASFQRERVFASEGAVVVCWSPLRLFLHCPCDMGHARGPGAAPARTRRWDMMSCCCCGEDNTVTVVTLTPIVGTGIVNGTS
jgi:hypothetical protein